MTKNNTAPLSGTAVEEISFGEQLLFRYRWVFLLVFILFTAFFGFQAGKLRWEANFDKMIPVNHPFITNYLENRDALRGLGDSVRIAVETTREDIFNPEYLQVLQKINDEVFFISGVDRAGLESLWTPQTRWMEVTEEGFAGGPVIPETYDGSPGSINQLKLNVFKSGKIGSLVANNLKSSIVYAPLLTIDPKTKQPLDYRLFSQQLETLIRDKYETEDIKIHITGFAKVVGELIDGAMHVAVFFVIAIFITMLMLYGYCRCIRSTLISILCAIVAVIWQLGILKTLGYGLDPFSTLVPFLIFAIGVSHGVQLINNIHREMMNGDGKINAVRRALRKIFKPGLVALVTDAIGFATLMAIRIVVIQELAIGASIGVGVLILTNLMLLPILMSYAGVSNARMKRLQTETQGESHPVWSLLSAFTRRTPATVAIIVAVCAFFWGIHSSRGLKIGDLDPGAPELRPNSRYNLDNSFMAKNFSTSTDILVVMVKTAPDECANYNTMVAMDRLQWSLNHLPGVQSTKSISDATKLVLAGFNEGSLKWMGLTRIQNILSNAAIYTPPEYRNSSCSLQPIGIYLNDHKAETLQRVVELVEKFAAENNTEKAQFLLAAGNAGIESATNIVIDKSQYTMLIWVYSVVSVLCLLTFRSFVAFASIIIPLALTSVLCQVVMVWMGIGVKVATLPVIALGVGVGVDYGIYIYSRLQFYMDQGLPLTRAYYATLKTTGTAVVFTGLTLAIGVCTWVFSPIKFQADMGVLLTFMFLVNMIGAIVLLPAIACTIWRFTKRKENSFLP